MKSIISIILFLVSLQTLKAQTFKTPSVVNMSKSYMPFNTATIDFATQKLTIGEFGKQSIGYTITNSPKYTPLVKKYYIECIGADGSFFAFSAEIANGEIVKIAMLDAKYKVDWVMSK